MRELLLVGLGGALGSVSRHAVGLVVLSFAPHASFPYATLAVNVSGCCFMGMAAARLHSLNLATDEWRLFVMTGILGGFTTFSAFSLETLTLVRQGAPFLGFLNFLLNPLCSMLAVLIGYTLIGWYFQRFPG
jgi:CrcB protein